MNAPDLLQVFLRYGSGFEMHDGKIVVGGEMTCFLQLRPQDRVTAIIQRPNPLLSTATWRSYQRSDYIGGQRAPGWVGSASGIDVFTTEPAPPRAATATCWVLRDRQPARSSSWFPADTRPVTGAIEHIDEISLFTEGALVSGVDRWLLESAVLRPVQRTWPKGLLGNAEHDQGRTLVVISVLLGRAHTDTT